MNKLVKRNSLVKKIYYGKLIENNPELYQYFTNFTFYMITKRTKDEVRDALKCLLEFVDSPTESENFNNFLSYVNYKTFQSFNPNEFPQNENQQFSTEIQLEMKKLKLQVEEKQNMIKQMKTKSIETKNQMTKMKSEIKQYSEIINNLKKENESMKQEINSLKKELKENCGKGGNKEIDELQDELEEARQMSLDYYNDVVKYRRQLKQIEQDFSVMRDLKEQYEKEIIQLNHVNDEQNKIIEELKSNKNLSQQTVADTREINEMKTHIQTEENMIKLERTRIKSETIKRTNQTKDEITRYSMPLNEDSFISKFVPIEQMKIEIAQFKERVEEKTQSNKQMYLQCIELENELRMKNGIPENTITEKEKLLEKKYYQMEEQIKESAMEGCLDCVHEEEEIMSKSICELKGDEIDKCLVYYVQLFLRISNQEQRLIQRFNELRNIQNGYSSSKIYEESIRLTESIVDLENTLLKVKEKAIPPPKVDNWGF